MPTKADYQRIINEKLSERLESQEKSKEAEVGGLGENGGVDGVSTKEEYE